jgi:hypothetical protein
MFAGFFKHRGTNNPPMMVLFIGTLALNFCYDWI